uniref:Uncharacterized protein n=1 Tax=Parascaris equorum TaxID=6256 RepID=A0A914RKH8_PAREQ
MKQTKKSGPVLNKNDRINIIRSFKYDTLETCMRLSKRFRAQGLEMRCHKFDRATHDACLPCVASSSLNCLEQHRNMITEKLLADLLAAKLRTLYDQVIVSSP